MNNEFPIGSLLTGIAILEDKDFAGDELCLDCIQLIFGENTVKLEAIADTDEIEISNGTAPIGGGASAPSSSNFPDWCNALIGKTLQTVWVCENSQGYRDQVIFAFDDLQPSIAFVAEGSVLKVFRYEQVKRQQLSLI